jgi:uncharacterized membrane protein
MGIATVFGALGQLLFKLAFESGAYNVIGYFGLYFCLGLVVYMLSTLFYFYVLSRVHLSWAYAISGLTYALAVILAAEVLDESVSPTRWAGVLVVTVGVILVGMS